MTVARRLEPVEAEDTPLPGMIGECLAMKAVYRLVRRVAPTELPVLIEGETGTGKELVARGIHALSPRSGGPFIDINCAAIPEGLVESELFGCEPGAFTGATQRVRGLLEVADGGTLFLDEACSLRPDAQAKLLRALERGEVRRVGGRALVRSDFRLIVAVSRPLAELLASDDFRSDFAFRVAAVTVTLPPLRARGEDIRLLAEWFLGQARRREGRTRRWHEGALTELERCSWPGNVRQLEMLVRRVCVLSAREVIDLREVELNGPDVVTTQHSSPSGRRTRRTPPTAHEIIEALSQSGGVVVHAARALGLGRRCLYRFLADCAINAGDFRDCPSRGASQTFM